VRAGAERKLGRVVVEHRALPAIGGPKLEHLRQLRLDGVVRLGDRRVHVSHGGRLLLAVSEEVTIAGRPSGNLPALRSALGRRARRAHRRGARSGERAEELLDRREHLVGIADPRVVVDTG
jgi:hypothetical protein